MNAGNGKYLLNLKSEIQLEEVYQMRLLAKMATSFAFAAAFFGVGTCSASLFYQPRVPEKLQAKNEVDRLSRSGGTVLLLLSCIS